eukprot:TRINITY_DN37087_c0_g1_i1.p2 TRINITY_DN37087_c0_g1~~TRINITY_DN37087_c0_g1_i1.p2  ORF type:complete len:507 (-),score=146.15 TRINITY_DN37087_c0_g1_i1:60-1580(-)
MAPSSAGGMRNCVSDPVLASGLANTATIRHRGANDVGTVKGVSGEQYVPRANWSEALDSPMKLGNRTADWDPQQFMREEHARSMNKQKMRQYLVGQRNAQYGENADKAATLKLERTQDAASLATDMETQRLREEADQAQIRKNREILRRSLDTHCAHQARQEREQRAQEAKEAAEMKLRTTQQLCAEMRERARRREMLEGNSREIMEHIQSNARRRRDDRANENQQAREKMRRDLAADEKRLQVTNDRIKAKQDQMQASADLYSRTAGLLNGQREHAETTRQENDIARHTLRMDMYYASREQARERERQQMIRELNAQSDFNEQRRQQARQNKSDDSDALIAANRRHIEHEMQKARDAKAQAIQVQAENAAMVEEKIRRETQAGYRRPAACMTMAPPGCGFGSLGASASPEKEHELMRTVDASRYLTKPLGKAAPQVASPSATRSPGAGPGSKASKQAFAHSVSLMARDHRMGASWHEGLSKEDLRAGRAVARRREAAERLSRADA